LYLLQLDLVQPLYSGAISGKLTCKFGILGVSSVKKQLLLTLSFVLSACTSLSPSLPTDNEVALGFRRPEPAAKILMLPPESEVHELNAGTKGLKEELNRQLRAAGYQVVILDQNSYDKIWNQEVEEVGGIYDKGTGALRREAYMQALGHLVQRVSSETNSTLVLRPQLVLRTAELSGVTAVWDGQQRRVPTRGAGDDTVRHNGTTWGLSVGLSMFAASGELVLSTHGGASLPFRVDFQTQRNEVRSDLFSNDKEIADAVSLALLPFHRAQ
jgi:hypothetical protein